MWNSRVSKREKTTVPASFATDMAGDIDVIPLTPVATVVTRRTSSDANV